MSEHTAAEGQRRSFRFRHRGRLAQVGIYFGKQARTFIYQNDWKVLPMAALIAGIVSMVIRGDFFRTMEGTLTGAFALTCVSIWNGCFNSIQVICRERSIIKREHRSGMHISSYIASHMLYQALLCLAQAVLTMYVLLVMGVAIPKEGLFSHFMIVDLGISVFLMTMASDMLSLWISALVRSTTTAMTFMPFILIIQLVFSGGFFVLPEWSRTISDFTISNPGLKCVCAQAAYNNLPMTTVWKPLRHLDDSERKIPVSIKLGSVIDLLQDENIAVVKDLRSQRTSVDMTVGELLSQLEGAAANGSANALDAQQAEDLRQAIGQLKLYAYANGLNGVKLTASGTVGGALDFISNLPLVIENRDQAYSFETSISEIFDLIGRDKLEDAITNGTKGINYREDYVKSRTNVAAYWAKLGVFILAYAALAMITLEFIDKDKR